MTLGNIIEFVLAHHNELYVGWPTEQIKLNVFQHVRAGGCLFHVDSREQIDGLVLYRLDPERHSVWIQEAYASQPGVLGQLLESGCRHENLPLDGSWKLTAVRRKYNQRPLTFPITQQTIRRLYHGN